MPGDFEPPAGTAADADGETMPPAVEQFGQQMRRAFTEARIGKLTASEAIALVATMERRMTTMLRERDAAREDVAMLDSGTILLDMGNGSRCRWVNTDLRAAINAARAPESCGNNAANCGNKAAVAPEASLWTI